MKKIIGLISDMHCGHLFGLTHPAYQIKKPRTPTEAREFPNLALLSEAQSEMWNTYRKFVAPFKGVDLLICVGDSIDGKGRKSGGTEQITTNLNLQIDMAEKVANLWDAKEEFYIVGTPYHTGKEEDWEQVLVEKRKLKTKASFAEQNIFEIKDNDTGKVFKIHAKHQVGGSGTPYGQASQTDKERVNFMIADYLNDWGHIDLFVRGHVHKYSYVESIGPNESVVASMTLPALQSHSKYGSRRLSSRVIPFGFVVLVIEDGRLIDRIVKIKYLKHLKPQTHTV